MSWQGFWQPLESNVVWAEAVCSSTLMLNLPQIHVISPRFKDRPPSLCQWVCVVWTSYENVNHESHKENKDVKWRGKRREGRRRRTAKTKVLCLVMFRMTLKMTWLMWWRKQLLRHPPIVSDPECCHVSRGGQRDNTKAVWQWLKWADQGWEAIKMSECCVVSHAAQRALRRPGGEGLLHWAEILGLCAWKLGVMFSFVKQCLNLISLKTDLYICY